MIEEKKTDSEFISSQRNNERNGQGSLNKSNINCFGLRPPKTMPEESINSGHGTRMRNTSKIDMIAFIAFTFVFFIFNFVYYIVCF